MRRRSIRPRCSPESDVLAKLPDGATAEFALLISDPFHGLGVGRELLRRLIRAAREAGLKKIIGYVLSDNFPMLELCRKLKFQIHWEADEGAMQAEMDLSSDAANAQILVA